MAPAPPITGVAYTGDGGDLRADKLDMRGICDRDAGDAGAEKLPWRPPPLVVAAPTAPTAETAAGKSTNWPARCDGAP